MTTITAAAGSPSPRMQAFLALVGWAEGCTTSPLTQDRGYDIEVTSVSGPRRFSDYSRHPFEPPRPAALIRPATATHPALYSTAAGRYQILLRYYLAYRKQLSLPDFSPASQDRIAIQMIAERGALLDISNGDIEAAITKCGGAWASFPNNSYGQGGHTMQALLAQWQHILATEGVS